MNNTAVVEFAQTSVTPKLPLRVLCVIPSATAQSKYAMIFAHRQVNALKRAGVLCETFSFVTGVRLCALARECRRLHRTIAVYRPDVVHAHYGTVTALCTILASNVPSIITFRGSDLNPDPSVNWIKWLQRLVISELAAARATRIICVSEQLKRRLWWRRERAVVIPTGVDTTIFYPRPLQQSRRTLGLPEQERVVLFNAGGNPLLKRQDLAEAGVEAARHLCGPVRLVVLNGDTPPDTVPLLMSAANCLLLTSDWEGSPTVVQEAIACNLPVVTVDVGDVRERLASVKPSIICSREPADIGNAIARILTLQQRSDGANSVVDISNDRVVEKVVSIYRLLVNQGSHISV